LKHRIRPFSREEISYPGGPQFSDEEEDNNNTRIPEMYTDERAIVAWLEEATEWDGGGYSPDQLCC